MKIFLDSNILIEYEKGTKTALLDALREKNVQFYINSIVVSEYLYKLIGILGKKAPLTIKESGKIAETLEHYQTTAFLRVFDYLPIPAPAIYKAVELIKKYSFLPNDALILASWQLQNIKVPTSYDSDFTKACEAEGLLLLLDESDLEQLDSH